MTDVCRLSAPGDTSVTTQLRKNLCAHHPPQIVLWSSDSLVTVMWSDSHMTLTVTQNVLFTESWS